MFAYKQVLKIEITAMNVGAFPSLFPGVSTIASLQALWERGTEGTSYPGLGGQD